MEKLIQHVVTHPFVDVLLVFFFSISILGFLARVKREKHPDYKPPPRPHDH